MKLPNIAELNNKVVIITGGAGVLGKTLTEALAYANATVVVLDHNPNKAADLFDSLHSKGLNVFPFECDVLDKSCLEEAHKIIIKKYGKIDVLINAAGGNHPKGTTNDEFFDPSKKQVNTFFDLDAEGIKHVFDLNFLGTFLPTQIFAKSMVKKGGSIINISSMNAFTPLTKIPAYSGAKAAVSNFTKWLAVHFSKVNIRVNAIAPGFFVTKQNEKLLLDENKEYTARAKKILNNTPMNRFGNSEELIGALLFLINEQASSFINGIVLEVDGGFNAYSGV